ncbi:MAG: hypothetical protein EA374_06305 [Acholeplasmatales bacterium]|nr:MAG: hypothetical protein EA374_06305 [Acholeplasmatales bacterium]
MVACESDTTPQNGSNNDDIVSENGENGETEWLVLTLEELAAFDGRDGRRGIIAYEGYLYDVSNSSLWPNGTHRPGVTAGNDLTIALNNNTRHGAEMLDRIPRIGELVE